MSFFCYINPCIPMYIGVAIVAALRLIALPNKSFSGVLTRTIMIFFAAVSVAIVLRSDGLCPHGKLSISKVFFSNLSSTSAVIFFCIIAVLAFILITPAHIMSDIRVILNYLFISSAIGVLFAETILSVFIYIEIMSIFSGSVILYSSRKKNIAFVYVLLHCISGILMMSGLIGYQGYESIKVDVLRFNNLNYSIFDIFFVSGLLINLGMMPFSYVIVDVYAAIKNLDALVVGSIATKIYTYVIIKNFFNISFLPYAGLFISICSIIGILINKDLRRIFAHIIIADVGIMICYCSIKEPSELFFNALGLMILKTFFIITFIGILYRCNNQYVKDLKSLRFVDGEKKSIKMIIYASIFFICLISLPIYPSISYFITNSIHGINGADGLAELASQIKLLISFIFISKIVYGLTVPKKDRIFDKTNVKEISLKWFIFSIVYVFVISLIVIKFYAEFITKEKHSTSALDFFIRLIIILIGALMGFQSFVFAGKIGKIIPMGGGGLTFLSLLNGAKLFFKAISLLHYKVSYSLRFFLKKPIDLIRSSNPNSFFQENHHQSWSIFLILSSFVVIFILNIFSLK